MSESVERLIISNLLRNEEFARKALPNIRREYFRGGNPERISFELIDDYVGKYGELPTTEALVVTLQDRTDLSEELFSGTAEFLAQCLADRSEVQREWMLDRAEEFCQDRAIHLALQKSLEILQDRGEKGLSKGSIPKMLQDALAVTFDPHIGHDYLEDSEERYRLIHRSVKRVPFDVRSFNDATRGGLAPKTLNVIMATSGAGKSLLMCHMAANHLMMGKNVLYVTLELAQEMVGDRIDANLMAVDLDVMGGLPFDIYSKKISDIRKKTTGKLIIKEYSQAGAAHFRHLLSELRIKKGFVPDVIYIDYLNICVPTGRKGEMNSYERVKAIAEELRAIGMDLNVPIVTATQGNRSSYGSSTVGMENVADSLGLPMTADWMIALVQTDELKRLNQYKVVQLKSRYSDIGKKPFWFVGVDKGQMRVYDIGDQTSYAEQDDPVPDKKLGADFSGWR